MAEQLALVKQNDFSGDISTLNLLPWLADNGWQMTLGDGSEPVDEAMTLHVPGTSDNNLATNLQALDALLIQVTRFANPVEPYGVWLRTQLPGETGARQALILEAKRDKALVVDPFAQQKHMLREYVLGLKRTPAWEDTAHTDWPAVTLGSLGGLGNLQTVQGDLAARLARVTIDAIAGTTPLGKIWLGFRSDRLVNSGYFASRWEAEYGHLAANVAITDANDATALGGTEITYTGETPVIADDAFILAHQPVKVQSITVTATIDGTDYTLTDALGDGALASTPVAAADEEVDPGTAGTLDHVLIVPSSLLFKNPGDDSEICHDDGAGNLRDPLNVVVGAIVYATGAWTTTDPITADADYEYGLVEATFNYYSGICTFATAGVTAAAVTYTSYEDRSIRVTFTDPTLIWRWYAEVSDITAHPTDQIGRVLVLGRFKVSDGSTVCRVRLETGFSGTRAFANRPRVVVSGDDWILYPLGYVSFPETGRDSSQIEGQRLRLSMERTAGTGTLDMDHLVMIPVDEGFISVEAVSDLTALITPLRWPVLVMHSAEDRVTVIGTNSGDPIYSDVIAQVSGGLPAGTNVYAVIAAQRQADSVWQDTIDLTVEGFERWITLRGAE
jgi:hypothetical protein